MNNDLIDRLYIELSYYPMTDSLSTALKDAIHEIQWLRQRVIDLQGHDNITLPSAVKEKE